MAITIEQQPDLYSPVFNPMRFVCSSSNVNGQNFFFFLVYVKDGSDNTISVSRIAPRYDNQLMLWDASKALEKYCTQDISGIANSTYGVRRISNVFKEYSIDFIEEYGSAASALATGSTTSTTTKYAFNGVTHDENEFDYTDYTIASGSTDAKLLTDFRGGDISIKTTDSFEIGWMTSAGATSPCKNVVIKTYANDDTLIGTYKIANSYASGSTTEDMFLGCLVGANDLNNSTLSSGSQPVITSNVYTYDVYIENNSGTRVSEILSFRIDRTCYRGDSAIRLHWVNSLGRIDSFNFNFESERSKDVTRSNYRKLRGSFTGDVFSVNTYEHGQTTHYSQSTRKIKVRSNYLNNTEAKWMENLIDSPAIWGEIDGQLIPLVMDTNNYVRKTIEKDKLFIVEFDLSYSVNDYRQRQ